nr:polysulfide reductase [Planctomycetales bacterium]
MAVIHFIFDGVREMLRGPREYWMWLLGLSVVILFGAWQYSTQLTSGLVVTGMSDQVSWGFYISNFAFLVGIAAAAVLLVIPAYIFDRKDIKDVVLVGEGMAVAAVTMAVMFVIADLGRPDRLWHLIPGIGRFHWPTSLLAWDVLVLNVYLLLNLA